MNEPLFSRHVAYHVLAEHAIILNVFIQLVYKPKESSDQKYQIIFHFEKVRLGFKINQSRSLATIQYTQMARFFRSRFLKCGLEGLWEEAQKRASFCFLPSYPRSTLPNTAIKESDR